MKKPQPVSQPPRTWYCEDCDQVFVLILDDEKLIRCNAPHHCHTGDWFTDHRGKQVAVVARHDCLPYSTTG